jgi:hypothetical protein
MIDLTGEQTAQVVQLLQDMEDGGACFAQVYADGMRVRIFDKATATRVREAIGLYPSQEGLHRSAAEAHTAANAGEGAANADAQ